MDSPPTEDGIKNMETDRKSHAKLDTDSDTKSDGPNKKPSWWVWVLILLGLSILCTLIILVVFTIRGSLSTNQGDSSLHIIIAPSIQEDPAVPYPGHSTATLKVTTVATTTISSPFTRSETTGMPTTITPMTPKTPRIAKTNPPDYPPIPYPGHSTTSSMSTASKTPTTPLKTPTSPLKTTTTLSPLRTNITSSKASTTISSSPFTRSETTGMPTTTPMTPKTTRNAKINPPDYPPVPYPEHSTTSSISTTSKNPTTSSTSSPPKTTSTLSPLRTTATSSTATTTISSSPSTRSETTEMPTKITPITPKTPTNTTNNEVVSATRVEKGSLSAKAYCKMKLRSISGWKLVTADYVMPQPSSVDARWKCWRACLGVEDDALLPTGETCKRAFFNSNSSQCILTGSSGLVNEAAKGWIYGKVKFECNSAMFPGWRTHFTKTNNRRLVIKRGNRVLSFSASSATECADGCILGGLRRCHAFTFARTTNSCMLLTLSSKELEEEIGTDFYETWEGSGVLCRDLYPTTTSGHSADGGIPQEGSFPNVDNCSRKCDGYQRKFRNGSICYGFDYNYRLKTCNISSIPDYKMKATPNTDNYRRDITCECSSYTKYISTVNTRGIGGRVTFFNQTPIEAVFSRFTCAAMCQGYGVPFNSSTCYGFSINHTRKACTLYHEFDFELDTVGGNLGVDTYRRLYQCFRIIHCKENYTKTSNAASVREGILQPKDINSVARCMDRCWGYVKGTGHSCYGFDFDREANRCTVYTLQTYSLTPTDGIDSYRRNMDCEWPY